MIRGLKNMGRGRKWVIALSLGVVLLALSGCQTFSFYKQAIKGQYELLAHRQPIDKLIADPQTESRLRQKLELLQKLRAFADHDLKLPVDGHYTKYVDVHRPFVVWNVEAAPEFSMEPKAWWYPLVGSLEYRGYFSEQKANEYANALRKKGYDVYVGGVEAYSTLGWFKDPALNTFIFNIEPDLAETVFHELGHQRVFARGDTDFNEAFATTVGQEGARRWLRAKDDQAASEKYLAEIQRTREFAALIAATREQLEAIYGDERNEEEKVKATSRNRESAPHLREQKKQILDQLQQKYVQLKQRWGGESDYDPWFARQVNNAKLNSVAAYYDLVPGFEHLLALNGGDLEKFYQAAERLAQKPKKERHRWLMTLGKQA